MTRKLKPCREPNCNRPRLARMRNGKPAYQERCLEHHREYERNRLRKKNGSSIPENAPALPTGRYILFDLPHSTVYIVKGKDRSFQPFQRASVSFHTIEILKLRKFDVRIIKR